MITRPAGILASVGGGLWPKPHRVQRRLAAILAADVAGYSQLMGADEEGTLARLKALCAELVDPSSARLSRRA
jgi:class 3 adenylate cyclase